MASNHKQQKMSKESSTIKEEIFPTPNINFRTSDFGEIVKLNTFVDKTLLIRTIFENPHTGIFITTFPSNGKSTNIDMVNKFVEIQVDANGNVIDREASSNYQIFKNLLIFQDKQFFDNHFAKYPVITIDLSLMFARSFGKFLDLLKYRLRELFTQHKYLLKSEKLSRDEKRGFSLHRRAFLHKYRSKKKIETGLKFLSKCLYKHFDQKVFILIDNCDGPLNDTMLKDNYLELVDGSGRIFEEDEVSQAIELLSAVFSNTLQDNEYLEKAFLTGISHFASVYLPDNIEKCMFLGNHSFVPYYGLTEHELNELLAKFNIDDDTKEKVKLYYNGYVTLKGVKLFSIWSILNFLKYKEIDSFWVEYGYINNYLHNAIVLHDIRGKMESICVRHSVSIEILDKVEICDIIDLKKICSTGNYCYIFKNRDVYLNYLLHLGYLTFDDEQPSATSYRVRVPNEEIISDLPWKLNDYYDKKTAIHYKYKVYDTYTLKCLNASFLFREISSSSEDKVFKDFITEFNSLLFQVDQVLLRLEDSYQFFMLWFLKNAGSKPKLNISSGGSLNFILFKDSLGIIIKLKHKESSKKALQQIIDQHLTAFDKSCFKNVTEKMYIGLNVSEKRQADISVLVNSTDVSKAKCF